LLSCQRLLFSRRFLYIITTCFGLTDHYQVYRFLWWSNLLLTVMLFCFSNFLAFVPITVAKRSKAWTIFARSNSGTVDSNPTQGMYVSVRLFCVCVVLCVGSGLAKGWSPVQGVLPTVYRIKKLKMRPRSNKRTLEP
jgi:hypothetical protein